MQEQERNHSHSLAGEQRQRVRSERAPRFDSDLARVLYGSEYGDLREKNLSNRLLSAFLDWLGQARIWQIEAHSKFIDDNIVARVAGYDLLRVAQAIDVRHPLAIKTMPRLAAHFEHLSRAQSYAEILTPQAIVRLAQALEDIQNLEPV